MAGRILLLDAARFQRLLRQANDAEVADVRKVGDDDYEIALQRSSSRPALPPAPREEPQDAVPGGEPAAGRAGLLGDPGERAAARASLPPRLSRPDAGGRHPARGGGENRPIFGAGAGGEPRRRGAGRDRGRGRPPRKSAAPHPAPPEAGHGGASTIQSDQSRRERGAGAS